MIATQAEKTQTSTNVCQIAHRVIDIEARAIAALKSQVNASFSKACELILNCKGRIIITGMGKSGHIGRKVAATLASTGTPAFFVHPGEASHGDLGMILGRDVVIAISYSGESNELLAIMPLIKQLGTPLIVMTGKHQSSLARTASCILDIQVAEEACPLGLAPTSSTTASLVMGDALAVALLEARGFTAEDFAKHHPGGQLGRRLLLRIDDIMRTNDEIPSINQHAVIRDALFEMTSKRLGMTTVVDDDNNLAGIFTDGDLRRTLNKNSNIFDTNIEDVMTKTCITTAPGILAAEALNIMNTNKITSLMVVDNKKIIGVVQMHDLLLVGI